MSFNVDNEVGKKGAVIFMKPGCPYCKEAIQTLEKMVDRDDIHAVNVNDHASILGNLVAKTGRRTVPNIFIRGRYLGGNDELQASVRSQRFADLYNDAPPATPPAPSTSYGGKRTKRRTRRKQPNRTQKRPRHKRPA